MKRIVLFIMLLVVNLGLKAQTNYPVIQVGTNVNNSPWYGLGSSNVTFPGVNHSAIQLAGYYGVLFKTTGGEFSLNHQGNVGVGTRNPLSKLQISGGSNNWDESFQGKNVGTIHLDPESRSNNFGNAITFGASDVSDGEDAQAGIYVRTDGSYGTKMYFSTTDSYTVGSKTAMIINHQGSVGIGTISPKAKLDVAGKTNVDNALIIDGLDPELAEHEQLRLSGYGVQGNRGAMYITNRNPNGHINFFSGGTHGAGSHMFIKHTGNIGIGTTTPNEALVVDGSIAFNYDERGGFNGIKRNGVSTEYYNMITGSSNSVIHQFTGTNKTIMSLTQGGNIGIGTTSPMETLTLSKNGAALGIYDTNPSSKANNRIARYANSLVIQNDISGSWKDNINFIDNGNVGVGTRITGTHKLAVEGSIGAREIKVEAYPNWSDFVFEDKYELPTLKEVENHIKEKGHLKDIPSAKEVAKNGIYLGEMNAKLLQKIEELTLYTIQQEKKIKEQEKELKKLKVFSDRLDQIEKMLKAKR